MKSSSGKLTGGDARNENGLRAAVIHPNEKSREGPASSLSRLEEAISLARAISLDIVFAETVRLQRRRPATLFGCGKRDLIGNRIAEAGIGVVIIDGALTPVQQRNLERAWQCKVIDRTGLILDIFADRARTRDGRLQVELAALNYQRSRLVRSWTHLERQRGGFGFLGGPGESQLESDRRQIDERIAHIRSELADVTRTRALHRTARKRVPYPVVALVGYTNAGKSTLFNRLTGADVVVADKLFATLDPTLRGVTLPSGRRVILSDTVGFVSQLPTLLVAAFRATLEEVCEADIIVHVRDIAHPESEAQKKDVHSVLQTLGLEHVVNDGLIEACNKTDLLDSGSRRQIAATNDGNRVALSARTGDGASVLLRTIDERCAPAFPTVALRVPHDDGRAIAWLYRHGEVIHRVDDDSCVHMKVNLDQADLARFRQMQAEPPA